MPSIHNFSGKLLEITTRFPWYSKLLPDLSSDSSVDHVIEVRTSPQELPLLTASILERYYYDAPPQHSSELTVYRTSGTSSGKRKAIYYSTQDDEHYIAVKTRLFADWLSGSKAAISNDHSGTTLPPYLPSIHKALSDMGTGHAASTAITIFERLGLEAAALPYDQPIHEHIDKLDSYQPQLLYTMPSILDRIVAAADNPSRFGVRKIILVGEIASPQWQDHIASKFHLTPVDILDTVGSIEIGTIAYYDHELGRYVIAEGLYAETVPAEQLGEGFEPLEDNEGVLVLTSFIRSEFPALRYVTYDVVRDFETYEVDGRILQTFTCLSKRIGPELKHGEKISLYDIEAAVLSLLPDATLKVRVKQRLLQVQIQSPSLTDVLLLQLKEAIQKRIPEIGAMIESGILLDIEVLPMDNSFPQQPASIKSKKITYEGGSS